MSNIHKVHHQWATRPDDQRYLDQQALYDATRERASVSQAETHEMQDIYVEAEVKDDFGSDLLLNVKRTRGNWGTQRFSNWSFNQLCTTLHVPAAWAKNWSHPALVSDALNLNASTHCAKDRGKIMVSGNNLRCVTGPDYGRFWDYQMVGLMKKMTENNPWKVPSASYSATDPLRATTLYASDRDVFGFLVNEENPVSITDEYGRQHEMKKFIMYWNSEVGYLTAGAMGGYYDFVCDNRIIWGARGVFEVKFKHSKYGPERMANEIPLQLESYLNRPSIDDERFFQAATQQKVANEEKDIRKFLLNRQFTANEATNIIEHGKHTRGGELPRTPWELAAAGTSYAQSIKFADKRTNFEQRASKILNVTNYTVAA